MMSCRVPPAAMMMGAEYPGSESDDSARQTSAPVSLSNATTLASGCPPTRAMSRSPSTSGAPARPQVGISASYSST